MRVKHHILRCACALLATAFYGCGGGGGDSFSRLATEAGRRLLLDGALPEALAMKIVRAIRKNRYFVTTTGLLQPLMLVKALSPDASVRTSARVFNALRAVYGRRQKQGR